MSEHYPFPAGLEKFAGQIMDTDAHEASPINRWRDEFGSIVDDFVAAIRQTTMHVNAENDADSTPITADTVFRVKHDKAPGAFDFDRRIEVMDFTGTSRQLVFPGGMGLLSAAFLSSADNPDIFRSITGDRRAYAVTLVRAYNDWCARVASLTDRLRPVAVLIGGSPEELVVEAKRLVDKGVRGFWFPSDTLPGGRSPASPSLDPLWALLADANAPVLSHTGSDARFYASLEWKNAPAFEGWKAGGEFSLDPWHLSNLHIPTQNFLMTLVMGGVFERHPTLRYGACEVTGHWIGAAADAMDIWHSHADAFATDAGSSPLKMKPSEYICRNTRVSCFDFEDVNAYIDRYGMPELYCYASDFPHPEGGKSPLEKFAANLAGKSDDIKRKFFVENGKLLLPD